MTGPTGKSIVRALLDPRPSHPPSKRVRELLAENVRLSAELAAANTRIAELERQADLSARQRNTAKFWVGH